MWNDNTSYFNLEITSSVPFPVTFKASLPQVIRYDLVCAYVNGGYLSNLGVTPVYACMHACLSEVHCISYTAASSSLPR